MTHEERIAMLSNPPKVEGFHTSGFIDQYGNHEFRLFDYMLDEVELGVLWQPILTREQIKHASGQYEGDE